MKLLGRHASAIMKRTALPYEQLRAEVCGLRPQKGPMSACPRGEFEPHQPAAPHSRCGMYSRLDVPEADCIIRLTYLLSKESALGSESNNS